MRWSLPGQKSPVAESDPGFFSDSSSSRSSIAQKECMGFLALVTSALAHSAELK